MLKQSTLAPALFILASAALPLATFAEPGVEPHRTTSGEVESKLPGKITDLDILKPPGPRNPASGAPVEWPNITKDTDIYSFTFIDRLEYGDPDGPNNYLWDAGGWVGGDFNKFWWKTEGEGPTHGGGPENTELQALYSRSISPFWNGQIGLRYDLNPNPDRGFAVLGFQGLAPGWFGTDTAMFISEDGDVSWRGEFEYEQLLTQRLFLSPRVEINLAAQDVPEYGRGSGVVDTEIGLRLRYQIRREFSPYIGVRWEQLYGETKDIAERAGESTSSTNFVIGLRAWF